MRFPITEKIERILGRIFFGEKKKKDEIVFWTCNEWDDELSHDDPHDAIEDYLDMIHPDPIPETVIIYGFKRIEVKIPASLWPLHDLVERLDEEWGSPHYYDPANYDPRVTKNMKLAEEMFISIVEREYVPWACEKATQMTVRLILDEEGNYDTYEEIEP